MHADTPLIGRMVETSPTGAIDSFEDGHVQGWAFDSSYPVDRLRVVILLDGEIAGFAHADQVRGDLVDRDIGDGAHGFRCHIPEVWLGRAGLVTVLAEAARGLVVIAERTVAVPTAGLTAQRGPALHFDITDLLDFLVHHREVTGIQRVQCGYLANVLTAPGEIFTVCICSQLPGIGRYVAIDPGATLDLLRDLETLRLLPDATWVAYIKTLRLGCGVAPDFRRHDVLLTLGASWARNGYYAAVARARADHGVLFMQMFHDLIPSLLPEMVPPGLIYGFNQAMAGMLGCADHVLANSDYSRRDLQTACARLGAAHPPVSVIPLGGTLDYRQDSPNPTFPSDDGTPSPRARFGDYVLCVGTIEPRKNIGYLATIWGRMLAERCPGQTIPKLICVGRMSDMVGGLHRLLAATDDLDGHFVHLTGIGDDALKCLYRDCLFTVFPSIYEGWGLPLGESLLFGKVCVSSNATSMPEVGGGFAIYIDPHDVADGYRVISGLLDDRAGLATREAALRNAYRPLTWREAARGMMDQVEAAHTKLLKADVDTQAVPELIIGRLYRFTTPPEKGGALAGLGHAITCHETAQLRAGPNWHGMEAWGSWSCGPELRLSFRLAETTTDDLVCICTLRLPHYAETIACRILCDGRDIGGVLLDGSVDHDVRVDLPAGTHTVLLCFRLEHLTLPRPGDHDQRLLGLGLRMLQVCDASDDVARLAYFESRTLQPRRMWAARRIGV